ncbi:hypothetical protein CAPTEDRAFT_193239 [Capitella teleta]|uniref:Nucleotide-diphospho-sugar transferase domain-containing protein n=1 Tax=Capitella teleta TaxID=283909 RepID=R7UQU6_CAPTE|nr:hypothetical protein CAPTEDRAFT_193239 [Capitella teleta]|eukprot:ELU05791.1 hypothetical protein CAPTEDRAFT_193239 [Capitella teleta]
MRHRKAFAVVLGIMVFIKIISVLVYRHNNTAPQFGNKFLRPIGVSNIVGRTSYKFCYRQDKCKTGKPFNMTQEFVRVMDQLRRTTVDDDVTQMVFVTAASANHFTESLDSIGSIQKHFPGSLILYYDWGLWPLQRQEIQTWCNVQLMELDLREFTSADRSKYYVWKIMVIAHALLNYPRVFWVDSSIRIVTSRFGNIKNVIQSNGGFAMFDDTICDHSTLAVTHPEMFQYFVTDWQMQTKQFQYQGGAVILTRTDFVVDEILQWLLLCVMHPECIAPVPWSMCTFKRDRMARYAKCHRHDQSAFNILASNAFKFKKYSAGGRQQFLIVKRKHAKDYKIKICPNQKQ